MKIKGFFIKNIKVITAFILGLIISGTGVYAATAAASDVSYSPPSGSGLSSNVQSAISELYNNSQNCLSSASGFGTCMRKIKKIAVYNDVEYASCTEVGNAAYATTNQSSAASGVSGLCRRTCAQACGVKVASDGTIQDTSNACYISCVG